MNNIEFFFQNPNDFNEKQTQYSTLFLLRRDILTCLGINPNDNSKLEYQAIFPGIMAIMAGIDLLSKFCFTDNKIKGIKSGERFRKFVFEYIDKDNKEVLYQLRNSLLHSFGLYSKDYKGKEYNFILDTSGEQLVVKVDKKNYVISVEILKDRFDTSIHGYMSNILTYDILKKNFEEMFPKYGSIGIPK